MDYSQETQDLIDRMCRNVEREDFKLDKPLAEELILKTYDLFNLSRPKKIKWCIDLQDKNFQEPALSALSARSALSTRSAWSALTARSAWAAGSALTARSAWAAGSAWAARSAWSAGSAWAAWAAGAAGSTWAAWSARFAGSALDYDFDWFIFGYEYFRNPDKEYLPNENDKIYLEYCELLMQAKEAGLGYRVEWEDTLYLVPTPLVKIDEKNSFHSISEPAIRWKGGQEIYYINGIQFEKELWTKVVNKTLSAKEAMKLENTEQRAIAIKMLGTKKVLDELGSIVLDEQTFGYGTDYLLQLKDFKDSVGDDYKILKGFDPAENDFVYIRVSPECKTVQEAQTFAYQLTGLNITYNPILRT